MTTESQTTTAAKPVWAAPGASGGIQPTSLADLPFRSLREEIDRVFESFIHGLTDGGLGLPAGPRLSPRTDLIESDEAYEMTVELPGTRERDLEATVEGGRLTIKGEKRAETERRKKEYHLSERSYGSFLRSLRLPEDIAVEKIAASVSDGVLRITMPKGPKAEPAVRKMPVAAGKKK